MKRQSFMLMMTLVLGGLVLSGCGKKDPSTSSAHPTTTGGGETSSSGPRNLANALKADYSNMTVEVSLAYNNDDMGIMEEYFQEVIYEGYTIIPPLSDGDPALYYHDYNGESYLYFADNYGNGDAWLKNGAYDMPLGVENTYFSWDYSVKYLDASKASYSAGYYVIADSDAIKTLNETMFRFAWFNDVEYVTLMVADGHVTSIVGLCSLENDKEYVKIKMGNFGNTGYTGSLPEAPNKDNVKTYYEYSGTEPIVDKYISSLTVAVEGTSVSDSEFDVILDIDKTQEVSVSYLPEDANKTDITWHSSNEDVVKVDYHNTSKHRTLVALKEGTSEIYATAKDANGNDVVSNKLKVKVNPVAEQNKEGCVYDFNFVNIANDYVIATNNIDTKATHEIQANRAVLRASDSVENRFESGRQLLCLNPLDTDFSKPSGSYVVFNFDDQQVSSISLYYGLIYSGHSSYLSKVNQAKILVSNDGENWTEAYDFLDEMKANISSSNKKLLETSFAPSSYVKIFMGASSVGNQFLFAMDNVAFMANSECHNHVDASEKIDVTGITITSTATKMRVGDSLTFVSQVEPSNATDKSVTWATSDASKLSINESGVATALAAGTVEVYATSINGIESNHISITIKEKDHLPKDKVGLTYVLDEELISSKWYDFKISILENDQVHIIVLPDGEAQIDYDFTLDYYDEESRYYVFANQGENTFKIKFVMNSTNCEVFAKLGSVELGNTHLNEGATFAQYFALTNITTTFDSKEMVVGAKELLVASAVPSNATYQSFTRSSSHPEVADFEDDESNYVVAKLAGTTTITFTGENGVTKDVTIVVKDKVKVASITLDKTVIESLEVGKSETVTATVLPSDATNKDVTWSSEDKKIATVDANGKITAVKEGKVNIICTSKENSEIKATVAVTVVAGTGVLPASMEGTYEDDGTCLAGTLTVTINATTGVMTLSCEGVGYSDTYTFVSESKGNYTFKNEAGNEISIYRFSDHIRLDSGTIEEIYFYSDPIDLYMN